MLLVHCLRSAQHKRLTQEGEKNFNCTFLMPLSLFNNRLKILNLASIQILHSFTAAGNAHWSVKLWATIKKRTGYHIIQDGLICFPLTYSFENTQTQMQFSLECTIITYIGRYNSLFSVYGNCSMTRTDWKSKFVYSALT